MKIAILTFHHAFNYGAELQCYALQHKLRLMGYDAEVIFNFRPANIEFKELSNTNFNPYYNINNKLSIRSRLNIFLSKLISNTTNIIFRSRARLRKKRFYQFHNTYTSLTKDTFYNFDMLYDYDWSKYTHFIVGSDQVWNYLTTYSNEPYFLTFAPEGAKRIAYAASIGHSKLPMEVEARYKKWLEDFDYISLREKDGCNIVSCLINRGVEHVLDPTLLLTKDEWNDGLGLSDFTIKDYVLVYVLIHSSYAIEFAKYIANKLDLNVKLISSTNWSAYTINKGVEVLYDCGPREFVELFYNAKFVVTNSFHGTAFAINMNKPFYSCPRENSMVLSRFTSLLNLLGLQERLIFDGSEYPKSIAADIDYRKVNNILNFQRELSIDFLKRSLGKQKLNYENI